MGSEKRELTAAEKRAIAACRNGTRPEPGSQYRMFQRMAAKGLIEERPTYEDGGGPYYKWFPAEAEPA